MYSIRRRLLSISIGKTEYTSVNTNSTNMLMKKNGDKNLWMTNILKHLKPHKKVSL